MKIPLRSLAVAVTFALIAAFVGPIAVADPPATQPADAAAQSPSLDKARTAYLSGDYPAAAAMYERLSADPRRRIAAAVGRADVDIQTGDYTAGIDRMKACVKEGEADPDLNAALADLEEQIGRYDEAIAHNQKALEVKTKHFRARWQLGRLYETLGRIDEAVATLKPFNDVMTSGTLPDSAEDLTWLGQGFIRYSSLSRHPELVGRTKHVLQNVYQEAFDFVDSAYWPARLAGARLLLDKFNYDEAGSDFKKILESNSHVADAHVALGTIGLAERWDFEGAEKAVAAALAINPHHCGARVLQAQARMTERRYRAAALAAQRALAVNPNHVEALSLLAAAQLRLVDTAASEQTQQRVLKINPKSALLHYTLGFWLVMSRQFEDAEPQFKKAMELAPYWSDPRTELGVMYMDTGEEVLARKTLDESFDLDRFNQRTFNILQLLDEIEKFDRITTKHFIIKYDRETDARFAPLVAETLEGLNAGVCADFGWTPDKPTVIEIFPSHASFSVRIAGRPFIATVGACTGRCIALVAPRGRPPFGRFNWASTLRHEYTHTVTLGTTANRIPHWFTEGLAVFEETHPRPWAWKQMLAQTVADRELFTLKTIDWGFQRPRKMNDRNLAYAQSEWMVEYIVERWGKPAILDLLKAFRERRTQPQALVEVLKIETDVFDKDFRDWAEKQVKAWGLRPRHVEKSEALKAEVEKNPENAKLRANYALSLLAEGEGEDAETEAQEALKLDKKQSLAHEVLALWYVAQMLDESVEDKRDDLLEQARPHIRALAEADPENPVAMKFVGYLEQHDQDWREALATYAQSGEQFLKDRGERMKTTIVRMETLAAQARWFEALPSAPSPARRGNSPMRS